MKQILTILFILISMISIAQPVEVDIFQKDATVSTVTLGVRVRATGVDVRYIGVTFDILYQSANAAPISTAQNSVGGVDDSKMVTGFNWGTSARFTNPQQVVNIDPGAPGGNIYDRRYVYGNIDENGGANVQTLISTRWDTLLYITLNSLQPSYPQGGYVYQQSTSEAANTALSDEGFANIPIAVNSGDVPLGVTTLPVLFTKFNAQCNNSGTVVSWATAQEGNSSKFEVQRSTDGNTWTSIATVAAAGNSASEKQYQQLDLYSGKALYRIKQTDKDGSFIYTGTEATNCSTRNITSVIYPVPAKDILNVVIKSDKAIRTQLLVYDISGKLMKKMDAQITNGNNTFKINLSGLVAGDYILKSSDAAIELNKVFTITR